MQELIQKIMDFLQNFDPSKILPNIAKLMTDAVVILRICVLAGPILLAVLGAVYFFLAPKEANHSVGYRFFWGMSSMEAWQFMQKLSGSGTAFLEIDGSTVEYDLERGQSMIVDTGYLAAMDDTCTMEIVSVPGIKNKLFGGEGLFNTVVHGPGHIILQSMPISAVASCLSPFFPSGSD